MSYNFRTKYQSEITTEKNSKKMKENEWEKERQTIKWPNEISKYSHYKRDVAAVIYVITRERYCIPE